MKVFTTIKVGYTHSIYGCSGEYFTTIYFNGKNHGSFCFHGLYGSEERVSREMQDKGYQEFYTPSDYGKMTTRGDSKVMSTLFMYENTAIKYIKNNFK